MYLKITSKTKLVLVITKSAAMPVGIKIRKAVAALKTKLRSLIADKTAPSVPLHWGEADLVNFAEWFLDDNVANHVNEQTAQALLRLAVEDYYVRFLCCRSILCVL